MVPEAVLRPVPIVLVKGLGSLLSQSTSVVLAVAQLAHAATGTAANINASTNPTTIVTGACARASTPKIVTLPIIESPNARVHSLPENWFLLATSSYRHTCRFM